jgi:hypothetical protein
MIDPKSHAEGRGWIETIGGFIPGFRGYLQRDYRQESDHLTRTWMADQLQQSKKGLDDYMVGLVNAGQLDALAGCERIKTRLDGLILKIRGAVRGYSGFFDFVNVDVHRLDRVYEHDVRLCQSVESLAAAIRQLADKPDPAGEATTGLLKDIDALDSQFEQRAQILAGLKED